MPIIIAPAPANPDDPSPGAPRSGVCTPWCTIDDLEARPGIDTPPDPDVAANLIEAASDVLYLLSGRQFNGGGCEATVRPSAPHPGSLAQLGDVPTGFSFGPIPSEITLGAYPVTAIQSVYVDGQLLDPSSYRVDDYRTLVRLPNPDGSRSVWPLWQRLDIDITQRGTMQVTFTYGQPPPYSGRIAAAALAAELLLAQDGNDACRLPSRLQTITRQGESMTVLDSQDFLEQGRTGIYECDLFLKTVNPHKRQRRSIVWSPELGEARRAGTNA